MYTPATIGMRQNNMKIIGITGGVGAGKSTVLNFLKEMIIKVEIGIECWRF